MQAGKGGVKYARNTGEPSLHTVVLIPVMLPGLLSSAAADGSCRAWRVCYI